jgi:hypothetical protein
MILLLDPSVSNSRHKPFPARFRWIWYIVYLFAILSGLFLAEMSLDRLIAIRFPATAVKYCTTSRAWKTVLVTSILIALLNANLFYTYRYHKEEVLGE